MNKELSPNTNLLHYKIISPIGKGGMGEVYPAKNTRLNRQVSIKLFPADFAADEDCVSRFGHEARAQLELEPLNRQ
jgi:serine/threonine protein kinase